MAILKLKTVRVVNPVPFNGPTATSLNCTEGTLEFDEESQLVIATPNRSSAVKSVVIPVGNIVFFEVLNEAVPKPVPVVSFPETPKDASKPRSDDTVRLTRNSK